MCTLKPRTLMRQRNSVVFDQQPGNPCYKLIQHTMDDNQLQCMVGYKEDMYRKGSIRDPQLGHGRPVQQQVMRRQSEGRGSPTPVHTYSI